VKLVINKKYPYKHYNRFSDTTGRKYLVDNVKVPSVTAILSATKDMRQLNNWRRRVGEKEADRIMNQASTIGTEMHQVLEYYLSGGGYYNDMEEGAKPRMMAKTILDNIKIDEVWGNEISLEYQNKFAGTCDMTAVVYGKPSIVDWKQANRPKKEEWVDDYKHQLGAYYLAHTANYGPIEQGVVSICTRDLRYQEFRLSEADLKEYADKFLNRLEQFNKLQQPVS
jgi:genome maintenance exonuclease 1|tara:strand:+ start:688 stop:1362 length:675 start_codon:yes stop_codon:yes gene_type:complete